jgi:hypothetical protein
MGQKHFPSSRGAAYSGMANVNTTILILNPSRTQHIKSQRISPNSSDLAFDIRRFPSTYPPIQ